MIARSSVEPGYFLTYSGLLVNLCELRPEDIRIEDIAHALANLCRFNGHLSSFYSVAEHSVKVSYLLNQDLALWGLLHDAAEAYLGDLVRPLKHGTPLGTMYRAYEARAMAAVCGAFGLPVVQPTAVKRADELMLETEWVHLYGANQLADRRAKIQTWGPDQARLEFLNRFHDLGAGAV